MFSQWYERAKAYAQSDKCTDVEEQEKIARYSSDFIKKLLQDASSSEAEEHVKAVSDIIEIIQTKSKFQPLEKQVIPEV